MLFNSFHFLLFFPVVVILYFAISHRWRWVLLLLASYYFYMCWKPEYVLLIIGSTFVDYYAGLRMERLTDQRQRKKYLILSLAANLGLLFGFKYFNFFNASLRAVFNHLNIFYDVPAFELLLPVGISFYTFQTLSYTIDVYRGKKKAETHLGIFALYVAFFPQLVAGPIERSTHLLPQFFKKIDLDYERVTDGMKLMLWGFFKKIVIADRLALFINPVYENPTEYQGISLITATFFFAIQIFCDFSGYSDIAIGAARIMGFKLMNNFNRPYYAKSVAEFWQRWHISLSRWFRDYLYIPLGGKRVSQARWYLNLFIVFLISGLWHGANWTFVIWGALHGFYLITGIFTADIRSKIVNLSGLNRMPGLHKLIRRSCTFSLVCFAWIFFRAESVNDAFYIVSHLFQGLPTWVNELVHFKIDTALTSRVLLGQSVYEFLVAVAAIFIMEGIHLYQRRGRTLARLRTKPIGIRLAIYWTLILSILWLAPYSTKEFIYFQF